MAESLQLNVLSACIKYSNRRFVIKKSIGLSVAVSLLLALFTAAAWGQTLATIEAKLDAMPSSLSPSFVALGDNLTTLGNMFQTELSGIGPAINSFEAKLDAMDLQLGSIVTGFEALPAAISEVFNPMTSAMTSLGDKLDALVIPNYSLRFDSLDNAVLCVESKIDRVASKLDDETRFTDDAELAKVRSDLTAEIDANETKIDFLEAKLDDAAQFTDDVELASAKGELGEEIDANEEKIDELAKAVASIDAAVSAVEAKLDETTETQYVEDPATGERCSRLDLIEKSIDALEAKLDMLLGLISMQ